jgi:hypothetical protein
VLQALRAARQAQPAHPVAKLLAPRDAPTSDQFWPMIVTGIADT